MVPVTTHSVTPSFHKLKQPISKPIVDHPLNLATQNKADLELLKVKATNLKSEPSNVVTVRRKDIVPQLFLVPQITSEKYSIIDEVSR